VFAYVGRIHNLKDLTAFGEVSLTWAKRVSSLSPIGFHIDRVPHLRETSVETSFRTTRNPQRGLP